MMAQDRWTSSPGDLIEFAHLIVAGAMNIGDPPVDPVPGWHEAARRWIDLYHEYLDRRREASETIEAIVELEKYTWEWVDVGDSGVQVRMDSRDVLTTFRFRPKPKEPDAV